MKTIKIFLVILFIYSLSTTKIYSAEDQSQNTKINVGINWLFLGDSQTIGRAREKNAKSHALVVKNIWEDTFGVRVNQIKNGESGRTLEGTMDAYKNISSPDKITWIHLQESGNQLSGGGAQDTPEKYAELLERLLRLIHKNSSDAIITVETAYSFEAESKKGRDWTKYNSKLLEIVQKLKSEGILVHIVNVDENIKKLISIKRNVMGYQAGQESVWGDRQNKIGRHYTGLGNFMVALSILDTLGIDLPSLDLTSISENEISLFDRDLTINILAQNNI